jgi:hypothetical protein
MYSESTARKYRFCASFYLLLVYAFGVFSKSAWSDDYPAIMDPQGVGLHATRDGRIAYGWAIDFLFTHFHNIDGLLFIRLLGLIGLILLNDLLIKNFLKSQFSFGIVVVISVAFTLPSFQFSAHWAIACIMSWTAYLAVLGYHLQGKPFLPLKILGFALFVLSLLIYPLMSFFVVSYAYALWLVQRSQLRILFQSLLRVIVLIVTGSFVSYSFAYLFLHLRNLSFNPRVALVSIDEVPNKLIFFFTRPFALTYRPFLVDSPSIVNLALTVSIFVGILFGLLWWSKKLVRTATIHFSIFNLFCIISLLPLLVVSQNQIDMRFVSSNTWLYVFVTSFFIIDYLNSPNNDLGVFRKKFYVLFMAILLSVGAFTLNNRFLVLFHIPYVTKQDFLSLELSKCTALQIQHQVIIVPRTIPWPQRNYIGAYSQITDLESDWVPVGVLSQYLHESGITTLSLPILGEVGVDNSACKVKLDSYPN